jgi:serine/threonine protein kinase
MTSDSDPIPNNELPDTDSMPQRSSLGNRGVTAGHSLKDIIEAKSLPETSSSTFTDSGLKVGPYRILQEIGRGGLGVVFLAEQDVISHEGKSSVKRKVAVKVIQQPRHAQTIIDECESLAAMNHPNIATIFIGGIEEMTQMPYFVLEYVDGTPLTKYCHEKRLTIRQRLNLFIQICNGIQHAHQKQVIHSDLKPTNILVTTIEGNPVPKIIDFGLSSNFESQTESGDPSGTWEYMPPEQAKGKRLDIKADIYSLGVILFQLMTGTLPIPSDKFKNRRDVEANTKLIQEFSAPLASEIHVSDSDRFRKHCESCDAIAGKHFRFLRGDLDCIIDKAIGKSPSERYDSASALAEDVARAINMQIPKAKNADTSYIAKKFIQRNLGLVSALAVIVALLVVGTTTTTWKWIEANRQTECQLAPKQYQ